jgi:MFS family permease
VRLRFAFRALGHRDYRRFFIGQALSGLGGWMQQTALPWLVFSLTDSPLLLGLVGACNFLPSFVLAPVAGVVADRRDRRLILLTTQTLALGQALVLGLLTLAGRVDTPTLVALALFGGLVIAFNLPAAQAFVSDLVTDKDDLPSALALNAALNNLSRVLGPALAGLIITWVSDGNAGESICFLLNAASYLAVLVALVLVRPAPQLPIADGSWIGPLKEGFAYVWRSVLLRDLMLLVALVGLTGIPGTLIPMMARKIGAGDARTFGFLNAATGFGALAGTAYVATRRRRGAGRRIALGAAVLGASLIGFAFSTTLAPALVSRFVAGVAWVIQATTCMALVQTVTDADKRGRVMSLFGMAFLGMAALGNLAAGGLGSAIGAEATFVVDGCCCLAAGLWFALRLPRLREEFHAAEAGHRSTSTAHDSMGHVYS